jgi:hypothetical protein
MSVAPYLVILKLAKFQRRRLAGKSKYDCVQLGEHASHAAALYGRRFVHIYQRSNAMCTWLKFCKFKYEHLNLQLRMQHEHTSSARIIHMRKFIHKHLHLMIEHSTRAMRVLSDLMRALGKGSHTERKYFQRY